MEIAYIDKSKLLDGGKVKDKQRELEAIRKELRGLQAGIDGYPMEISRLTNKIQLLKNKSFTVPLDFEVTTEVTDDPERLEIERNRFLEAQELAQKKISELKAQNLRDIGHVKKELETYKEERQPRHEKGKDRIKELEQKEQELTDELNAYVVVEVRPVLNNN